MAHHEVVENNVKKELSYSLIGVLAFLGVVLLILISAIVRPAGNHVDVAKLNAEVEAKAAASAAAAAKPALPEFLGETGPGQLVDWWRRSHHLNAGHYGTARPD